MIAQDSPQDADGFASGGDAGNARMFGKLQVVAVAHEDGLMQEQGSHGIHQGTAEIDIAGFEDMVALASALAVAGVVAAADQARAAEDLGGTGVVGGCADGGSQAGDLNRTQALEVGPDLIGCLGHELAQALFELIDERLDVFEQRQVVLQQFAADGSQFRVWQECSVGQGDDFGGCDRPQTASLGMKGLYQCCG